MKKRRLSPWVLTVAVLVAAATGVGLSAVPAGSAQALPSPESFAGYWYVHGSQLFIDSLSYTTFNGHKMTDWYGIETDSEGSGVVSDLLSLSLSANKTRMEVTTVGVSYMNGQSGTSAVLPDPTQNLARGDSYVLVFVHPFLMKDIDIHTRHVVIGNPYWCGQGLAPQYQQLCGA
ncbi:MAG: hypothetical protein ACLQVK_03305 [Acidimicrobiales bacterium]|jgi:hypothetical protein